MNKLTMHSPSFVEDNIALVVRNWLFGWYIVEFENGGEEYQQDWGINHPKLSDSSKNGAKK